MKLFDLVNGNQHPFMEALAFHLKHYFLYVVYLMQ